MPRIGENIYERKDGRFEGRYIKNRDENGKAKYAAVYGHTKQEVREKLAEAKARQEEADEEGIETFEDAYQKWLSDRRDNISAASVDRYEYLMERYILPHIGSQDVKELTPAATYAVIASLADKNEQRESAIKGTTVETLFSLTKSIINYANNHEYDVPKLSEKVKIEKSHYLPLSRDEMRAVAACARYNRVPEMLGVLFSLYAGIGTGELCALLWDDVDIRRREIHIRHTLYRMRDSSDSGKKTKLMVTNVRKSNIRTVAYPVELAGIVKELHKPGTVFLTGEKDRYMEQRTFSNHIEAIFAAHGIKNVLPQRLNRTFKDGLSDIRFYNDPFYRPGAGMETGKTEVDEKWLLQEMVADLKSLRGLLGISTAEMGHLLGLSKEDYIAIEVGEEALNWPYFLSLLFLFKYNGKTGGVVDALGLYPQSLQGKITIKS